MSKHSEETRWLGKPVTAVEIETLQALITTADLKMETAATALCCHANSVKYRIDSLRAKWGVPHATIWELVRYGVEHGYVLLNSEQVIEQFVTTLLATLPTGQATPLSTGIRQWLEGEADRFVRQRTMMEAAA